FDIEAFAVGSYATGDQPRTVGDSLINIVQDSLALLLRNQGAHGGLWIHAGAKLEGASNLGHALNDLVGNTLVNVEPRTGRAHLPGVHEDTHRSGRDSFFEVCIRVDHNR